MFKGQMMPIIMLFVVLAAMWILMIRPDRKRRKETESMRAGLQVGDEIVTIGGICAKIVKTKAETIVIQVGADKTKMEVMRWAVSKVVKESTHRSRDVEAEDVEEVKKPRRLKKAAPVEETEEKPAEAPAEAVEEAESTEE